VGSFAVDGRESERVFALSSFCQYTFCVGWEVPHGRQQQKKIFLSLEKRVLGITYTFYLWQNVMISELTPLAQYAIVDNHAVLQ